MTHRHPVPHVAMTARRRCCTAGLLVCLLLLEACAVVRDDVASDWPEELPPVAFFTDAYRDTPGLETEQPLTEYLYWVKAFYSGTALYPRGWSDLVAEQIDQSPGPAEAERRQVQLYNLGRDIAAEWAKANSVRRVDNRHLQVWGSAAGRAIDEGNVDDTLIKIAADLELLLAQELGPDAITAERYHAQDPDDWFAL